MTELEKIKAQRKEALEKIPPLKKGEEYAYVRKLVAYFYNRKEVQDLWREVLKANGLLPLVEETLEETLRAEGIEGSESDKKAFKRTTDSGTFLYHSDFVRMLNSLLGGKLK